MSCYFRHIKDILNEASIEVTSSNKKQLDRVIHELVGVAYKDCPTAWRKLKEQIVGDEKKRKDLVRKLKAAMWQ
jgi:ribosomal protein L17